MNITKSLTYPQQPHECGHDADYYKASAQQTYQRSPMTL